VPRRASVVAGVATRSVESQALTKDVVNIGPGERYDLLMTADNPGTWLFHCHILTHVQNHGVEPGGMIAVFKVTE
jgi:FtsP/CotA-like multicopper oxidase with cupredoxin domain